MTDKQINAHVAVSRWLKGEMTVFQAKTACGDPTVAEMYEEYMEIEADVIASSHVVTAEEAEHDELVDLAYQIYGDLLREEPAYLEQIIEGLQRKRRQNMLAFAARFNSRRRASKGSNILPFVRH